MAERSPKGPKCTLSTEALLMAQYGARPIIMIEEVRRDYFGHLSSHNFKRKLSRCEIDLPIVRLDTSRKANWVCT